LSTDWQWSPGRSMSLEQQKTQINLKNHFPIKFRFAGFHFLRHPRTWNVEISGHSKTIFTVPNAGTHHSADQRKLLKIRKIQMQISPLKSNVLKIILSV
jgi:hypothetical protein